MTWNTIDEARGLYWGEYSFTKGASATCMVIKDRDGLIIVSPPSGMTAADFDGLAPLGDVKALIANNFLHHVGQPEWRKRFPNAKSYASRAALPRLKKKSSVDYLPLDELALPDGVTCETLPGFKNGEVLVRVAGPSPVWYTGDLLVNMAGVPKPPIKWLFTLTDSAPGFRFFRLSAMLFLKDKGALRERVKSLLTEAPPSTIVPGHGVAVSGPSLAEDLRAQLARI